MKIGILENWNFEELFKNEILENQILKKWNFEKLFENGCLENWNFEELFENGNFGNKIRKLKFWKIIRKWMFRKLEF